MELGIHDLHMELDGAARTLKLYDANHHEVFGCEARNRTTANGQYGHDGNCPPGEYELGLPSARGAVPFGAWFIPLYDYNGHESMRAHGRSGIGIHGGGTGLARPMAARQGWQITHGCWRLQNQDLAALVSRLLEMGTDGGTCYVTVAQSAPGGTEEGDDWAEAAELCPDE